MGKAQSEIFAACVVNKMGLRPSGIRDAERQLVKWAKAMGADPKNIKIEKRVIVTSIKSIIGRIFR